MIEFNFPRWLNEYEREVAVYIFFQAEVRFSGGPDLRRGIARWFCGIPRPVRQRAYREYTSPQVGA